MSAEALLINLTVGLIAGWLVGQIVQGTGFGGGITLVCRGRELRLVVQLPRQP